jgi:hypothetical protein
MDVYWATIKGTWAEGTSIPVPIPVAVPGTVVLIIVTGIAVLVAAVLMVSILLPSQGVGVIVMDNGDAANKQSEEDNRNSDT